MADGIRRQTGIRVRTTAAAVVVVGVVLVLGSIAMLAFVEGSLVAQVGDAAELRAQDVAAGGDGAPIESDEEEEFVQVVREGGIVRSTPNVDGLGPVATPVPEHPVVVRDVPVDGASFVVASATAGDVTVLVGRNADDAVEARRLVSIALLIGVPVVLAIVGLVTWWITGRALRPVDAIRDEVDRISVTDLGRRVPAPPGDDEIARLAATMNAMLGRLQASVERQRRFVSDASHELRSPVAAIRQHAEVAREHPGSTSPPELADAVLVETERLQSLVEDLLVLARLDEAGGGPDAEVDLDDLVLAEAARVRAAGTTTVDTTAVTAARTRGSASSLGRMVRNLADNASRFASSRVAFGLATDDGRVLLTVEDDGPGIAPADRERAFERFERLDEGRARRDGGAGLGLAIVREVARSHGGDASLGVGVLGGLRVEVRLPPA